MPHSLVLALPALTLTLHHCFHSMGAAMCKMN